MLKLATRRPNFSSQLWRAASLIKWPIKQGNVIHGTTIQPFYFSSMSSSAKDEQKRIKQLVNAQPQDGWDKCWEEGITPWDLGNVTPIISHWLLQNDHQRLPHGRALVPGCGTGYDVIALADPSRYVIGIDISEKAISQAKELAAHSPNSIYCQFLKTDFFTWKPSELFDLIFDYTFFCAIEPSMRAAWAKCIAELLKFDGELITLIFPISDHEGGPPYSVSLKSYEDALHPWGFKALYVADNEMAIKGRKGRELVARWKRDPAKL